MPTSKPKKLPEPKQPEPQSESTDKDPKTSAAPPEPSSQVANPPAAIPAAAAAAPDEPSKENQVATTTGQRRGKRGPDKRPRQRRTYQQLEDEKNEPVCCPVANCLKRYIGKCRRFNLLTHIRKQHPEWDHEAGHSAKMARIGSEEKPADVRLLWVPSNHDVRIPPVNPGGMGNPAPMGNAPIMGHGNPAMADHPPQMQWMPRPPYWYLPQPSTQLFLGSLPMQQRTDATAPMAAASAAGTVASSAPSNAPVAAVPGTLAPGSAGVPAPAAAPPAATPNLRPPAPEAGRAPVAQPTHQAVSEPSRQAVPEVRPPVWPKAVSS